MKKKKSVGYQRLHAGAWERDGSLFKSDYYVPAAMLARSYDNSAIEQNRVYTHDTIVKVTDRLNELYGDKFTPSKVGIYINNSATDSAYRNKENTQRVNSHREQNKQLREVLLNIK